MKKFTLLILIFATSLTLSAQVAINIDGSLPAGSAILDVKSTKKGALFPRMTTYQRQNIVNPATGLIVYDTSNNALYVYDGTVWKVLSKGQLWTQSGSITYLNNSNKVGIGTSSPMGKLHIHDATHNTTLYITPGSTGNGDSVTISLSEDDNATYGMYWLYDGTTNSMKLFGKENTVIKGPHFIIKRHNGYIAIGEHFADGYRLSVDGKIMCEEVRVNLSENWPDYVFNKNYKLMPVNELDGFIKTNGHLPNIPSSSKIKSAGLEVGEMQRLMMEKIEELSLYIINQQKQIEELKVQIEKNQE